MSVRKIIILPMVIFLFTITVNVWSQSKTADGVTIWSFTDELGSILENYYKPAHPGVKINYSLTPYEYFNSRLDPVLASGRGAPDVFALESSNVRKYVESGLLLDLTDIYERNRSKLLAFPIEIGTHNGRVYALSWQSCPGAMFYRRSLARKYLGTDDPEYLQQTYFANFNKFMDTAETLKRNSNGACVAVASRGDLFIPFLDGRKSPWIVNGKLVIDPALDQFMEMSKLMYKDRYEGRVGQWSEGWFDGMKGDLRDESGKRLEVFSYFLPTWGLHYVLKTNAPDTSGDWAMIPGPVHYSWGGTWLGAYKNTGNVAAVEELIEWITANDRFAEQWAKDTGDMVNNLNIIDRIKMNFSEPFLGGQFHYAAFAAIAGNINGRLKQTSDDAVEGLFREAIEAYINGEKTKAKALADFRRQVEAKLGL